MRFTDLNANDTALTVHSQPTMLRDPDVGRLVNHWLPVLNVDHLCPFVSAVDGVVHSKVDMKKLSTRKTYGCWCIDTIGSPFLNLVPRLFCCVPNSVSSISLSVSTIGCMAAPLSIAYFSMPCKYLQGGILSIYLLIPLCIAGFITSEAVLVMSTRRVSFALRSDTLSFCVLLKLYLKAFSLSRSGMEHCDIVVCCMLIHMFS